MANFPKKVDFQQMALSTGLQQLPKVGNNYSQSTHSWILNEMRRVRIFLLDRMIAVLVRGILITSPIMESSRFCLSDIYISSHHRETLSTCIIFLVFLSLTLLNKIQGPTTRRSTCRIAKPRSGITTHPRPELTGLPEEDYLLNAWKILKAMVECRWCILYNPKYIIRRPVSNITHHVCCIFRLQMNFYEVAFDFQHTRLRAKTRSERVCWKFTPWNF